MSYDHIRAVAERFNGSLAERMILTAFAVHVNPKTGFSTVSIVGVARFCKLQPSYVRRIVRSLEGSVDAEHAEPGKWLYPLNKSSRPGDGQATCYRMFLDAYTAPIKRRAATNPTGINRIGVGVPEPRSQEPTRGFLEPTPVPGFQEPTRGFQEPQTWVPGTSERRFQEPTKAIQSSKAEKSNPYPDYVRYLVEVRRSGGDPLTLADWRSQGASPPHPPEIAHREASHGPKPTATNRPDDLPAGARQLDLSDLDESDEPTIIPEIQS